MALAWINANDQNNQQNQINELNTHQDSICTSVRSKFNSNGFFDPIRSENFMRMIRILFILHQLYFRRLKQLVILH